MKADIESKREKVINSFSQFFIDAQEKKVSHCVNIGVVMTPVFLESSNPFFNKQVEKDVLESILFVDRLSKAVELLPKLKGENYILLEKHVRNNTQLVSKIQDLFSQISQAYQDLNNYFIELNLILTASAILCGIFFVYSLSLLMPNKTINMVPAPCQIITIAFGILFISTTGCIMYYKSQLLVKNCIIARKFLDSPQAVHKYFNDNDEDWMKTCIAKSGSGNIESFIDTEAR